MNENLNFDKAIKRFNDRRNDVIASALVGVSREIDIKAMQDRIVFTIKEIK